MRRLLLPVLLLLAAAAPFPPGATVDTIDGVRVADPYRQLENGQDPSVQAWSRAENARTRAYLDALPFRATIADRLRRMITATSPSYAGLQARGSAVFALYADPARQQPMLVRLAAAADPASRTMVLDPNTLDRSGHTEIDWYVASPDGTKVAVSLSRNGSEDGTLHVYDVASGHALEAPIANVQYPTAGGSVGWLADGRGFFYTRYPGAGAPAAERHFNQQVYLHFLGGDAARDQVALSAADGLPRTGEIFLANETGAGVVTASVQLGDGGQWQQYVLRAGARPLKVAGYGDQVVAVAVARDGTLFGVSRHDAPMGEVLELAAPYAGGFARARVLVPESSAAAIIDGGEFQAPLTVAGGNLFVNRIAGGPSEVEVYDRAGHGRAVGLPPVSAVTEMDALPDGDVLYRVEGFLRPPYFERWHAADGRSGATGLRESSPISFEGDEVTRVFATSKDGTRVPVSIIAARGVRLDGRHPLLLNGYGGFGIDIVPQFAGPEVKLWLDAGGIYAVANIRGGGEYGARWHEEGMLTHKQNVFDDFAACARYLIAQGYTSSDRLGLIGGSNGGLLMGAEVTQHPALARAVVSLVGIYDMVRLQLDPNGAFNVTEYGSTADPAQFRALYAYSPYHHVVHGVAYPAVLMETGANDGRVNPMQSRKFTAALQAATSSDRPILLATSQTSGHGIGSSLNDRINRMTDALSFLFAQLGMNLN